MIKSFIRFAIERPILNHILFIMVLLMAVFAYQNIPKEIFPPSELDQIVIQGGYAGASADVLDKMAVRSLEDDLKSVDGIATLDTTIQNDFFQIVAKIKNGADNQLVLSDAKDVIATIKRDLPSDMNEPIAKIATHNFPLLLIAISADVPKQRLLEAAEALESKISSYKDLAAIDIRGDADNEVKIRIDDKRLVAYGIPKPLFYRAIGALSSIYPIGTIKRDGKLLYLSTINGEKEAKKLEDTLISVGNRRIRLGTVADVSFGLSKPGEISHFNGKKNISINTTKTKKGNAIALSREIRTMIEEFKVHYPDLEFKVYTDTSMWIKNRINLVTSNIFFGLILVFLALFLSVNYKIATVVLIGIPTSFFIALIGANLLDYSMNMLTMLGALVALGMLVDEAIVVAENIFRHMEMGKSPKEAAIDGATEMFPAVLTATATTTFAFLPLLILSGEMGMFMKVVPVMITILLISSLFEAFYFLPLHAREIFVIGKTIDHHEPSGFWDGFTGLYGKALSLLLRFKKLSLLLLVTAIVSATIGMISISKFQLFPEFDTTQIYIGGEVDVNSKLKDTEATMALLEQEILKTMNTQEVDSVTSVVGMIFKQDQTFELGEHLFQIFINMHEKSPKNFFDKHINPYLSLEYQGEGMIRDRKAQEVFRDLQKNTIDRFMQMKDRDGNLVFKNINAYVPQTGIVGSDIEIGIHSDSNQRVKETLNTIKKELGSIQGVRNIADNAKEGATELKFRVNRHGQSLGFNEDNLVSALRGLFLEAEFGKMFNHSGLIRLRIEENSKNDNFDITHTKVTTPDGGQVVALKDIVDFSYKKSMLKFYKEDGEKVWTVTAGIDKKIILASEVMKRMEPLLNTIKESGTKVIIKGEEQENQRVKKEMGQAAIIAVFLIFISLVWMFNSLAMPLIIVSTIPLSILGALIGSYLLGINLTMPGIMGMVGLAGVVVNDGLIMLDFVRKEQSYSGMIERAKMRLRPIFLTSVTTVLGLSTLMFFASGQALIIQPMAVSLGFGVAWSTVLNLLYVPLMYAVVYRIKT